MSQTPPGWYPDPADRPPAAPPTQRWWDGSQWTEHVQSVGGSSPVAAHAGKPPALTPDGQPLAGWWRRYGAFLVDWLVLLVAGMVIGFPFVQDIGAAYADWFEEAMQAARAGGQPPPQTALMTSVLGPTAALNGIILALDFVYTVSFLKALSATPGKLLLGMRVRVRETPGPLSWGVVLRRWGAQNLGTVAGLVPFVGTFGFLYTLLDHLWPLWDEKKQALHDKFASTNVVRKVS